MPLPAETVELVVVRGTVRFPIASLAVFDAGTVPTLELIVIPSAGIWIQRFNDKVVHKIEKKSQIFGNHFQPTNPNETIKPYNFSL